MVKLLTEALQLEYFLMWQETHRLVELHFIKGFTKPVIGAKVGDTVQGDVTFPDDYSQSYLQARQ